MSHSNSALKTNRKPQKGAPYISENKRNFGKTFWKACKLFSPKSFKYDDIATLRENKRTISDKTKVANRSF